MQKILLGCGLFIAAAASVLAQTANYGGLARKNNLPLEKIPGTEVSYDSISSQSHKLRRIVTYPENSTGKLPAIFMVGWLSCDSTEQPRGTEDGFVELIHEIAAQSGFITVRIDKPGVGDSEGDCSQTDLDTELAGYQDGFRSLASLDRVDPQRIFIIGFSNGGGFAPLVPRNAPVRGYLVFSGWLKTWYEHMLEHERRRLARAGDAPGEINRKMRLFSRFYDLYLNQGMTPGEIVAAHPEMKEIWYDQADHQYGRPAKYYQQLQQLNLEAAWEKVSAPVLAGHGEDDWIMSRDDVVRIAEIVNKNHPGSATYIDVPKSNHDLVPSSAAMGTTGKALLDRGFAEQVLAWLAAHK
jgi:pimeloyl-ACP methyl ester carboxylesterase